MLRTAYSIRIGFWITAIAACLALGGSQESSVRSAMHSDSSRPFRDDDRFRIPLSRSFLAERERLVAASGLRVRSYWGGSRITSSPFYAGSRTRFGGALANPSSDPARFVGDLPAFERRDSLPAGLFPTAVAAGDFNRDGNPDFVVSNAGDHTLWINFGRGDGTFAAPTIIPLWGKSPIWLVAADLRGIGILDLVVAELESKTLGVLLGKGDGTFQEEALYSLPAAPGFLIAADFDNDSKTDLVAGLEDANIIGPVALLRGDGKGLFGSPVFTPSNEFKSIFYMAAGDLNGDRYTDLVVSDISWGQAQVWINNRDGSFSQGQVILSGPGRGSVLCVDLGDLNRDGALDVVVMDAFGQANVYYGKPDGTFDTNRQIVPLGDLSVAIALRDINGDRNLDLITSSLFWAEAGAGNLLTVWLGDGAGKFFSSQVYAGEPSMVSIAANDFNRDGQLDLVTANNDTGSCTVFLNDGKGDFGPPRGGLLAPYRWAINGSSSSLFADVNNDGSPDFVLLGAQSVASKHHVGIITFLNDGNANFRNRVISETSITEQAAALAGAFALGDFRSLGKLDFLAVGTGLGWSSAFLAYAPNESGGRFGVTRMSSQVASGVLGVGDFNEDGRPDIVTADENAGPVEQTAERQRLTVFLGEGEGSFRDGQLINYGGPGFRWPRAVHVGDYNRDGHLDVLVWLNDLFQFFGNGDGTLRSARLALPNLVSFSAADLNSDGSLDVVEGKSVSTDPYLGSRISVYLGREDGSFSQLGTLEPYGLPRWYLEGPMTADLNGDGNSDIVCPQILSTRALQFQVLLGNGDGTFTPSYYENVYSRTSRLLFADLDNDRRSDLIELTWPDADSLGSFTIRRSVRAPMVYFDSISYPVKACRGIAVLNVNVPSREPVVVRLAANDPAIHVPESITVPAGALSYEFEFSISARFDWKKVVEIRAQAGNDVDRIYTVQDPQGCRFRRRP